MRDTGNRENGSALASKLALLVAAFPFCGACVCGHAWLKIIVLFSALRYRSPAGLFLQVTTKSVEQNAMTHTLYLCLPNSVINLAVVYFRGVLVHLSGSWEMHQLWNMLPIAIRQAASLFDFHGLVSAYLGLPVRSHRLLGDPCKIIKDCYFGVLLPCSPYDGLRCAQEPACGTHARTHARTHKPMA